MLDYAEGSFAEVVLQVILPHFRGADVSDRARSALGDHLSYIAGELDDGLFLCGTALTLADIQMSYLLALLDRFELLDPHPGVAAYWGALQKQPGYIAAVESTGPMAPPR